MGQRSLLGNRETEDIVHAVCQAPGCASYAPGIVVDAACHLNADVCAPAVCGIGDPAQNGTAAIGNRRQALLTLVFIVLRAEVILVLAAAILIWTVFAISVNALVNEVLIAVIAFVTAVLIPSSAVVMVVLIVAQLVLVLELIAVQVLAIVFLITPIAVSTVERILRQAVVIVFFTLFQLVVVLLLTAVHALAIVFLITPVAVVTVDSIAVQVVLTVC